MALYPLKTKETFYRSCRYTIDYTMTLQAAPVRMPGWDSNEGLRSPFRALRIRLEIIVARSNAFASRQGRSPSSEPDPDYCGRRRRFLEDRLEALARPDLSSDPRCPLSGQIAELDATSAVHRDRPEVGRVLRFWAKLDRFSWLADERLKASIALSPIIVRVLQADDREAQLAAGLVGLRFVRHFAALDSGGTMVVDPSTLRRGIYRIKNPEGLEDDAQVRDVAGGSDMPLSESVYRERGYEPPFDDLPWREDYLAVLSARSDPET